MNPQPQPNNSPLKVVPPQGTAATPLKSDKPTQPAPQLTSETPVAESKGNLNRWAIAGVLAVGVGTLGLIPLPNYVTGEAEIDSRPGERQAVTTVESGIVDLRVRRNDRVQAGDILATIDNPELEDRIAEVRRSIEQEESALQIAERELIIAQTRLMAAQTEQSNVQRRLDREFNDYDAAASGTGVPQTRQVEREIDGIRYEIAGYENEVARLEGEIAEVRTQQRSLEGELGLLREDLRNSDTRMERLQPLIAESAIADEYIFNVTSQRSNIARQIEQKEGELEATIARIAQLNSQIDRQQNLALQRDRNIDANRERIQDVRHRLEDELMQVRDELDSRIAQRQSAEEEVTAAAAKVQSHQDAIASFEAELERLEDQRGELTLRATTDGTVITEGLDLRDGTRMEAGETLLQIVDLGELEARVQIAQGDKNLVSKGQLGRFQTENQGNTDYRAEVSEIGPSIDSETPGAKPVLEVTLLLDNDDGFLLPGQTGHVHIRTVDLNLYQKIQHQFGKLFDISRYVPWMGGGIEN
ncbi:efflux RND transporter periplasmic adaptor subunit [Geitlerinema sp. CS-897]|nr:efflux RND transporter periplasmic adaptor subunit [Geitlerinema sp. CS-897]